jgi:ABC-type Fe3+-hydroxamate transport system substrate-binding protein
MPASGSPTSDRVLRDDTGRDVIVPPNVSRVVSLVPSLTESISRSAPGLLVGATDWCTHPAGLDVTRVGGTKNPDVPAVLELQPDLVVANFEENRPADLEALRAAGIAVWVTAPETVPDALASLARMLAACRVGRPRWLDEAAAHWQASYDGPRRRAFVPIWRKPWMSLGRSTFAGDLLARLGIDHVHADAAERYPRVDLESTRALGVDLVVLPDEPYAFTPDRDLDAFAGWDVPVAFVSGRHLTWYGPSLAEARDVLAAQLAQAMPAPA